MYSQSFWQVINDHQEYDLIKVTSHFAVQRIKLGVAAEKFPEVVATLKKCGAFLLTMTATDKRKLFGNFAVYSVFALPAEKIIVEIKIVLEGKNPTYQSITPIMPAAHWLEREMKDLFGIIPKGHPDMRRLAVHQDWPANVYPLRKDFISNTKVPRVAGEMEFCSVKGEGIYQVPVGPIHAGIIEPGHFRFFAFGEDVINLQAQLFYTHRGIEKAAEGKSYYDATLVAERVCGACSASHVVAYAQAIETLAGVDAPKRALYSRTILLELERLYNHIGDIGNICAGVGFSFGISRGAILKERLMRINMRLTGHRYLRGMVIPGGLRKDLGITPKTSLALIELEQELNDLTSTILSSQSILDRLQTTGILDTEAALTLGAVGPAARASGVNKDLRRDLPYGVYRKLDFRVPVQTGGDVYCRLKQRIEECQQSFAILQQAIKQMPQGKLVVEIPHLPPYRTAVGYTESARGANVHWVMSGPNNTIYRYMVRSASHCNWPVLTLCVPGNIIPDFPLINKSFELCYACLDR